MSEPKYTKKEQREHMADFERDVKNARYCWAKGEAIAIISLEDSDDFDRWVKWRAKRRRACSGST